jgi:hypothetical protein
MNMALPTTIAEADARAVLAYRRAAEAGSTPHPDSPLAKAALKAVERQEQLHPDTDFVKATIPAEHQPVPQNDAIARMKASLTGQSPHVDLSGGASTILQDGPASTIAGDSGYLERMKVNEQARALLADPAFPAAMEKARATAAREGRQPTAADLTETLAAVKAEQRPQPPRPPQPVTALFAQSTSAAKATSSGWSPVPDRFGGK